MTTVPVKRRGRRVTAVAVLAGGALLAACGAPDAPQHPTWAQVQPILRAECSSCHSASAAITGGGTRFDFYDMSKDLCGDAAQVLDPKMQLAAALSVPIWNAITTTPDRPYTRPRMPPEPAPYLADWEWKTVRDWVDDEAPKGDMPLGNTPARIQLYGDLASADQSLDVTAVVEDPDGDPVVGVLTVGDATHEDIVLKMDRGGAFSAHVDTSSWPAGQRTIATVLCDGWSSVHYLLGTLTISHGQ